MDKKNGYALFDLDHTLLPFDTQVLFCNYVLQRQRVHRRLYVLIFALFLPFALVRICSIHRMKRVFASYLWRMPEDRLRQLARKFAEEEVPRVLYPEVLAELKKHQEAGRITILNSASPELYTTEIARVLGFDHCVATRLRVEDPMPLIPKIDGPNNKHGEKIPPMIERGMLPEGFDPDKGDKLPDSYGYSDSQADVPLLSICENATMIHPSDAFAAIGKERGWKTLTPDQPYDGKWGGRSASVKQALGIYRM
jgi:HAD superfamily hydrolase (TIGR01490 family)